MNRITVAARLAATSTATSAARLGRADTACSATSAPEVTASPMPNAIRPRTWWRAACIRPRMPKVTRRLTAVLATAVRSRLIAFAACAAITPRNSRYSRT